MKRLNWIIIVLEILVVLGFTSFGIATAGPIKCSSGAVTLSNVDEYGNEAYDYVIEGDGNSCIHATAECVIDTQFNGPVNIIFENCSHCIRAEGGAIVDLLTEGSVTCEQASEDGIRTRGHASVAVEAPEMVFSADGVGLDAGGNSYVRLRVMARDQGDTSLIVIGSEVDIRAEGNATANIFGTCEALNIWQSGNASVTTTCGP